MTRRELITLLGGACGASFIAWLWGIRGLQ
jgi:hypothetical protein